jgi:hypothetical protein
MIVGVWKKVKNFVESSSFVSMTECTYNCLEKKINSENYQVDEFRSKTLLLSSRKKEAIHCEVWGCDGGVARDSILPVMTRCHNQKS